MVSVPPPLENGFGGGGGPGGPPGPPGPLLLFDNTMYPLFSVSPAFIAGGYSRMPPVPLTCALLILPAGPSGSMNFISIWMSPPVHLTVLVDVFVGLSFLSNIWLLRVPVVVPPLLLTLVTV